MLAGFIRKCPDKPTVHHQSSTGGGANTGENGRAERRVQMPPNEHRVALCLLDVEISNLIKTTLKGDFCCFKVCIFLFLFLKY